MCKLLCSLAIAGYLAAAETARAEDTDPAQNPARQKAVAWIKENNAYGVDARIVKDMTDVIDKAVLAHENFALSFGEKLLSGGAPAEIVSWDDAFLVVPLTPEQARQMDLKPSGVDVVTNKTHAKRAESPAVEVQSVKFDNAANVDGSKKLTGELTCKIVGKMPESPAIRLSYFKGSATSSGFSYPDNLRGNGAVTVKFSFSPINSSDDKKKTYGPLPAFVDVVTVKEKGGNVDVNVISNTVGELLTVNRPE